MEEKGGVNQQGDSGDGFASETQDGTALLQNRAQTELRGKINQIREKIG